VLLSAEDLTNASGLALRRCEDAIKDLNQLLEARPKRQGDEEPRNCRRLWLKRKHINKHRLELERARRAFSETVIVETWYEPRLRRARLLLTIYSLSTQRQETGLVLVGRQSSEQQAVILRINERLARIEDCMSASYAQNSETPGVLRHAGNCRRHRPVVAQAYFRNAYPEAYTVETGTPLLYIYYSEMKLNNGPTGPKRSYRIGLYFQGQARKWLRIELEMTVAPGSKYWTLPFVNSLTTTKELCYHLPTTLRKALEEALKASPGLRQDHCSTLQLSELANSRQTPPTTTCPMQLLGPGMTSKGLLRDVTEQVQHWGCPRYQERQFDFRPRASERPLNAFIAHLDGRWVFATRFRPVKRLIDRDVYNLRVLQNLKDCPQISNLLGLLCDDEGTVTGYLHEMPAIHLGRLLSHGKSSEKQDGASRSSMPWQNYTSEIWCLDCLDLLSTREWPSPVMGMLNCSDGSQRQSAGRKAQLGSVACGLYHQSADHQIQSRTRSQQPQRRTCTSWVAYSTVLRHKSVLYRTARIRACKPR
jgi:hypothetical protein